MKYKKWMILPVAFAVLETMAMVKKGDSVYQNVPEEHQNSAAEHYAIITSRRQAVDEVGATQSVTLCMKFLGEMFGSFAYFP